MNEEIFAKHGYKKHRALPYTHADALFQKEFQEDFFINFFEYSPGKRTEYQATFHIEHDGFTRSITIFSFSDRDLNNVIETVEDLARKELAILNPQEEELPERDLTFPLVNDRMTDPEFPYGEFDDGKHWNDPPEASIAELCWHEGVDEDLWMDAIAEEFDYGNDSSCPSGTRKRD